MPASLQAPVTGETCRREVDEVYVTIASSPMVKESNA
jgi:hypothetical protein